MPHFIRQNLWSFDSNLVFLYITLLKYMRNAYPTDMVFVFIALSQSKPHIRSRCDFYNLLVLFPRYSHQWILSLLYYKYPFCILESRNDQYMWKTNPWFLKQSLCSWQFRPTGLKFDSRGSSIAGLHCINTLGEQSSLLIWHYVLCSWFKKRFSL